MDWGYKLSEMITKTGKMALDGSVRHFFVRNSNGLE